MLKKISKRKLIFLTGDLVIITLSYYLSFYFRFGRFENILESNRLSNLIFIAVLIILSFYIFEQYNIQKKHIFSEQSIMFLIALVSIALIMSVCFYFVPFIVGRGIFFFTITLVAVLSFIWRAAFPLLFGVIIPPKKVLLLGGGRETEFLNNASIQNSGYNIVGWVDDIDKETNKKNSLKFLGRTSEIERIIDEYKINETVVLKESILPRISGKLINMRMKGVKIHTFLDFYESINHKLPVTYIKDKWMIYSQGFEKVENEIYKKIKRGIDIILSTLFIIISIPITIIIIIMIKLTSKGSVFHIQERLGKDEKPFQMIKFRTMIVDAEKDKPQWAEEDDRRITKIGKILRKTRVDELPQLINILKGEMSFIGPRPEREYFVRELKKKIPYYSLRFVVKPGLTGWAQVNYRYGSSIEDAIEKLTYDLYYIKNMSLFLDLRIILKTIRICLFGMGR